MKNLKAMQMKYLKNWQEKMNNLKTRLVKKNQRAGRVTNYLYKIT